MPPRRRSQKTRDPSSDDQSSQEKLDESKKSARRIVTVYDAVAGRAVRDGFAKNLAYGQQKSILTPDEVLFKSKSAPPRFAEDDVYCADQDLPPDSLPESDLLEGIHVFAADYYRSTTADYGRSDSKSLDASALLALGILLEESAREVLGETGDLAFVEGQPIGHDNSSADSAMDMQASSEDESSVKATTSGDEDTIVRRVKRRRRT